MIREGPTARARQNLEIKKCGADRATARERLDGIVPGRSGHHGMSAYEPGARRSSIKGPASCGAGEGARTASGHHQRRILKWTLPCPPQRTVSNYLAGGSSMRGRTLVHRSWFCAVFWWCKFSCRLEAPGKGKAMEQSTPRSPAETNCCRWKNRKLNLRRPDLAAAGWAGIGGCRTRSRQGTLRRSARRRQRRRRPRRRINKALDSEVISGARAGRSGADQQITRPPPVAGTEKPRRLRKTQTRNSKPHRRPPTPSRPAVNAMEQRCRNVALPFGISEGCAPLGKPADIGSASATFVFPVRSIFDMAGLDVDPEGRAESTSGDRSDSISDKQIRAKSDGC